MIVLKPDGLAGWLVRNNEERAARVIKAIQTTVALRGPAIAQDVVAETRPLPVDRGEYRRGFHARDTKSGAVFLNSAPHAPIVEMGRRPGRYPPLQVIERWVRRKFRLQLKRFSARRARGGAGLSEREREVRSATFLVSRAIARRGIPGKHVMARVEKRLTPEVEAAARAAAGGEGGG